MEGLPNLKETVKLEEPVKDIVLVRFPSLQLLTSTFLRFQEYYESPKFKGTPFTLEEFVAWYTSSNGAFNYYEEWDGFNIPSSVLKAFYEGHFDPLSQQEREFLDLFRQRKEPFYIIGTSDGGDPDTLKHEVAHALFHLNESYRKEVQALLKGEKFPELEQYLLKVGYHQNVIDDEVHAYLLAELDYLEEEVGLDITRYAEPHRELNDVFKRYYDLEHVSRGH